MIKNGFGFTCLENQFANIPIKISGHSKYLVVIAGLIISYIIISVILFIHDFVYRHNFLVVRNDSDDIKREYTSFEINLSQDTVSDREVLKRINDKVLDYWRNNEKLLNTYQFQRAIYKPLLMLIELTSTGKRKNPSKYHLILNKLETLQKRLAGAVSTSQEMGSDPGLATTFVKGMSEITIPIGKISDRNTVNYNIASAKEAEDELISIFNEIDNFEIKNIKGGQFIFIIDELDKIEPQSSSLIDEREFSNPALDPNLNMPGSREYRKRQEAVARLLANLKGFLNAAKAKFFFIGGRELFDADLADIADRDSFYSSIFNSVIYVDSFYKDNPKGMRMGGITSLTETFLINLIVRKSDSKDETGCNLKSLYEKVEYDSTNNHYYISKSQEEREIDNDKFKLFSLLQNYIIYLAYRGTGAPKKLTSLVENLIVKESYNSIDKNAIILLQKKVGIEKRKESDKHLFLKFSYNTQYEINLTTHIFRPYLITNSRFLTNLGDKLLFSTPFIFDHIIKFYPYGFSWRNLELIPEVVLVNKEPYLRDHIKSILQYLSNYHIKQAVSGLYQYRFHSIVRKELSILTKRSDLAAAAFNFTLDESLLVKRHYKKKLIELREKYKNYQPLDGDNQFVHSISFVQTVLGDLYFYDKEYDEAILYYTESIQSLRLPNGIDNRYLTRHQYLIWLRNKLKIGLTLEKMEAYDSAISLYRTLMIDSERYLQKIVNSNLGTYTEEFTTRNIFNQFSKTIKTKQEIEGLDPRSESHRNIHLITLPFVAQLAVIEKNRTDGITYANLYGNKEELRKVIEPEYTNEHIQDSKQKPYLLKDSYRKGWLWADYFGNVGSILFFKNCQFTRFFTANAWIPNAGIKDKNQKFRIIKDSEYEIDENNNSKIEFDNSFYLKTDFPNLFSRLHNQYQKYNPSPSERSGDYFPSLTSICYYWEALHELTNYHSNRVCKVLEKHGSSILKIDYNPLQYTAFYLLPDLIDMVNGRRFYYLANMVSKIGDAILASLSSKDKETAGIVDVLDYNKFKESLIKREKILFKKELIDVINSKLSIDDNFFSIKKVLYIYALANELFKRSGQNYYYTFGQKKVLTIIKEIVSLSKYSESFVSPELDSLDSRNQLAFYDLKINKNISFEIKNICLHPSRIMGKLYRCLDTNDLNEFSDCKVFVGKKQMKLDKFALKLDNNFDFKTKIRIKFPVRISSFCKMVFVNEEPIKGNAKEIVRIYKFCIFNRSQKQLRFTDFKIDINKLNELYSFKFQPISIEFVDKNNLFVIENESSILFNGSIAAATTVEVAISLKEKNNKEIIVTSKVIKPRNQKGELKYNIVVKNKSTQNIDITDLQYFSDEFEFPEYDHVSFKLNKQDNYSKQNQKLFSETKSIKGDSEICIPMTIKTSNCKIPNPFKVIKITEDLCLSIIRSTSWYNSISNRAQIKKYRDIFYLSGDTSSENHSILYNNTSNHSDALEALTLTETIKMRLDRSNSKKRINLRKTDNARTKYIRLLQLKYHVEKQYHSILQLTGTPEIFEFKGKKINFEETEKEMLKNYLFEAFFALRESIKIIQMYTPGYIIGYSYLATAHAWAGKWCLLYENYFKYNESQGLKVKDKKFA